MSGDIEAVQHGPEVIDLRRLACDLRPLVGRWRTTGIHLGIPSHELDAIESRTATAANCFSKVIERFLEQNPHSNTEGERKCQEKIVEALYFPSIAKGNLARDIQLGTVRLVFTEQALNRTLDCCTAQWQQFALALNMPSRFIDSLKCEHRDISQYFSDMLRYWLNNSDQDHRLTNLVAVVRTMDQNNLADKIEAEYRGKVLEDQRPGPPED